MVFGNFVVILLKMMIEILLFRLCLVICLLSYIRNIVFVISVMIVVRWNSMLGLVMRFGWFFSVVVILNVWKVVSIMVKYCVYCVIFCCFVCFFFFSVLSCGEMIVSNCMMIDVEMYGMIFSVKIVKWESVLFENMLNMFRMLFVWFWNSLVSWFGLMFGMGMCVLMW